MMVSSGGQPGRRCLLLPQPYPLGVPPELYDERVPVVKHGRIPSVAGALARQAGWVVVFVLPSIQDSRIRGILFWEGYSTVH